MSTMVVACEQTLTRIMGSPSYWLPPHQAVLSLCVVKLVEVGTGFFIGIDTLLTCLFDVELWLVIGSVQKLSCFWIGHNWAGPLSGLRRQP